ncbi:MULTISPECIES: hypothetical protein [Nocardia]|uniref:Low molecular weight antigen MTB12-like C-terminal domain-containing protein n=1 Tax=Nocardia vinacea TaxID=96468 RepID=A0ABZ1YLF2_9NOCA|nr:hypothetical protein [Nocardia vinacea]
MYDTTIRTIATWCGIAAITVATATACGSTDKTSGTTTTTAAAASMSSTAAQADSATTNAVTHAFVAFFDTKTPVDQRVALVENGTTFAPVLTAQADNPATQTTATVSAVQAGDAAHATVTYTLLMGGNPVLPDQSGQAVQENGQWKVAATTFCALVELQGGPVPGC